jgi:hypothetical protein
VRKRRHSPAAAIGAARCPCAQCEAAIVCGGLGHAGLGKVHR